MNYEQQKMRVTRISGGALHLHLQDRNIIYDILPWEERSKDVNGLPSVLTAYQNKLSLRDLFKLAKRLEKDDVEKNHDWNKAWNYLHSLEHVN